MDSVGYLEQIRQHQGEIEAAERLVDEARRRNAMIAEAVAAGVTKYAIAKELGVTANSVAKMVNG